jgi:hypothetical protein
MWSLMVTLWRGTLVTLALAVLVIVVGLIIVAVAGGF